MIKFACTCHAILEVSDAFAGTSLQCPQCKRLVDVPTLGDLKSIDDEGSYKVDAVKVHNEPDRLEKLHRAFTHQRTDQHGRDIDLRQKFKGGGPPMGEDDVLEILDVEPIAPKYDPETGELIRSVPLKHEPVKFDPSTLPMAKAVINYASGSTIRQFSGWRIYAEIFRFQNLVVMSCIFIACFCMQLVMVPIAAGMYTIVPGFVVLCFGLVAHFSNVVNEIGVEQTDELPRPLRDLNWHEDVWGPFMHFTVAFCVSYLPIIFTHLFPEKVQQAYVGAGLIMGTIAFPALFLTTATSGTVLNLAPDCVLRVITAIGLKYPILIVLWAVSVVAGLLGLLASFIDLATLLTSGGHRGLFGLPYIPLIPAYGLMILGVLLMHGFCWYLGLQYRAHYDQFDWYYQKHHRKIETVQPPVGTTMATPSIAPPMATAIAPPSGRSSDYPQSDA